MGGKGLCVRVCSLLGCIALLSACSAGDAGLSYLGGQEQSVRVAALGDSITTAFNSQFPLDNPRLSWTTGWRDGDSVESISERISSAIEGSRVQIANRAFVGAKAAGIERQAQMVANAEAPDLVTTLIGANDICSWQGDDAAALAAGVKTSVRRALATIHEKAPGAQVVTVPVPDLVAVKHLGRDSCQRTWDVTSFCPQLFASNAPQDAEARFAARRDAVNRAIRELADEQPNYIHHASALESVEIHKDDIATLDCFHPSAQGQHHIASAVWEAVDVPALIRRVSVRAQGQR